MSTAGRAMYAHPVGVETWSVCQQPVLNPFSFLPFSRGAANNHSRAVEQSGVRKGRPSFLPSSLPYPPFFLPRNKGKGTVGTHLSRRLALCWYMLCVFRRPSLPGLGVCRRWKESSSGPSRRPLPRWRSSPAPSHKTAGLTSCECWRSWGWEGGSRW